MVRDMDLCNFSPRTVESYVDQVRGLAKYYRWPPDQLSNDEIQRYLLYVREERRLSSSTCNQLRAALKFFYEVTLQRPHVALALPRLDPRGQQVPGEDPFNRFISTHMERHTYRVGIPAAVVQAGHKGDNRLLGDNKPETQLGRDRGAAASAHLLPNPT